MATANVNRAMLWTDLEGQSLPGGWRLVRLMRPEGRTAWFEAQGPDGKPAMVCLTEALNDEDELLARLRAASGIRHPNVVAVREARLVKAEETPMVMAAMEPTEENLADVLRERVLNAGEARVLMDALLKGLAAIHARRLTHGRMDAASVLATGDTVKLRSDCLHGEEFEQRAAADVAGVGRIVAQALTRRIPANEHDASLQTLPESMRQAVRRALSGQATVEEVATLAGVRIVRPREVPVSATAVAEPAPVKSAKVASGASVTAMPAPKAEPKLGQMDLPLRARHRELPEEDEDGEPPQRRWEWKWPYHRWSAPYWIVAAALLAGITAWMLSGWMGQGRMAKGPAVRQRVVVQPATAAGSASAQRAAAAQAGAPRVWRVVVDTYRNRGQAAGRAKMLEAAHPGLRMGVLATHGGDFLVTVGGRMTREQAMALRARVARMGLPRDAYAQNFR